MKVVGPRSNHGTTFLLIAIVVLFLLVVGNLIYTTVNANSGKQYQTLVGPSGPQGPQGERGLDGLQGLVGLEGEQGPPGPPGPQGMMGAAGADGKNGEPGPTGLTGAMGAQGAEGPMGPQGPQGLDGLNGTDGREVELRANNEDDQLEWKYVDEDETGWRLLIRYCEFTNTCAPWVPPLQP